MGSLWPKSWLVLFSLFLSYVAICSADALEHWAWADHVSCMPRNDDLLRAWQEFAVLADKSFHVLSRPLSTKNGEMFKAMYNLPINQTEDMKINHKRMWDLARDGGQIPYSLYCDDSAIELVTKVQTGPHKGKDLPLKDRYVKFTRNPPGQEIKFNWPHNHAPCYDSKGYRKEAFSVENATVLCPEVWNSPTDRLDQEHTRQPWGTYINHLTTVGSTIFHELTHLRLQTKDYAYDFLGCFRLARTDAVKAQHNANSMTWFAIGVLYTQDNWSSGWADRPLPANWH